MLSLKLFTEFLPDISKSCNQDHSIPVDILLMVGLHLLFADDLVFFSESASGNGESMEWGRWIRRIMRIMRVKRYSEAGPSIMFVHRELL